MVTATSDRLLPDKVSFFRLEKEFEDWLQNQARVYVDHRTKEAADRLRVDLWTDASAMARVRLEEDDDPENTAFTDDELKRIATSLAELVKKLETEKILTRQQVETLNEQVAVLIRTSHELVRKEWLRFTLATLITFGVGAGLAPDVRSKLLFLGVEAVRWVADSPRLLP